MWRILFLSCLAIWLSIPSILANKQDVENRLADASEVLKEVLGVPEGLPEYLLDRAECVVVIPAVKRFAIGIGGSYGRGAMVCRSGPRFDGPWGPPAMFRLEGGSIGFQLGGSETDYVLLVMNEKGVRSLLSSKVKLGADASVAAGPKGRSAEAATDAFMRAEILTYSRSRGLFAGISLEGSTLRQDNGPNRTLYGKRLSAKDIIEKGRVSVPDAARELVDLLQRTSPENRSD